METKRVQKGLTVKMNSQLLCANGTWRVYNLRGTEAHLARVGVRGQMLTPNRENLLTLDVAVLEQALSVGTAQVLA